MAIAKIPLRPVDPADIPAFIKHILPPTFSGGPLDAVKPVRTVRRDLLVNFDLKLMDGTKVPMWIIEDPDDPVNGRVFPSKTIRTVAGDVIHAPVGAKTNTHTIHWHGIEPSPMNDGVGKHSFEISGNFVYQFDTDQAGTFFYHCHKNTVLHFEMGLYGMFIVDPPKPNTPDAAGVDGPPYKNGGPGFIAALNPPTNVRKYDIEAVWVPDEIDSRWHELGHDAFMQGINQDNPIDPKTFSHDGILNDFRPDIFLISGKGTHSKSIGDSATIDPMSINAKVGQTVLVRLLNAGYTVNEYHFGLPVEVVAQDGHPLGVGARHQYSAPFTIPANQPFRMTGAMRRDLLIKGATPGKFPCTVDYLHWVTGKRLFTAQTFINVT